MLLENWGIALLAMAHKTCGLLNSVFTKSTDLKFPLQDQQDGRIKGFFGDLSAKPTLRRNMGRCKTSFHKEFAGGDCRL